MAITAKQLAKINAQSERMRQWAKDNPEVAPENMIPLDQLIKGARYKGEGRNFSEAVWNGKGFIGMRNKFGDTYEFMELHWDSDPHYGTFAPLEILGKENSNGEKE